MLWWAHGWNLAGSWGQESLIPKIGMWPCFGGKCWKCECHFTLFWCQASFLFCVVGFHLYLIYLYGLHHTCAQASPKRVKNRSNNSSLVPAVVAPSPCSPCWLHALSPGPSLSFFLPHYLHIISRTMITLVGRSYCTNTENCSFDTSQQIVLAFRVSTDRSTDGRQKH